MSTQDIGCFRFAADACRKYLHGVENFGKCIELSTMNRYNPSLLIGRGIPLLLGHLSYLVEMNLYQMNLI